jgi:hypothetical protein
MEGISKQLTFQEIRDTFSGDLGKEYPPILSPEKFAKLVGKSRSTIYEWIRRGDLDGALGERAGQYFVWRDRAIQLIFNRSKKPWHPAIARGFTSDPSVSRKQAKRGRTEQALPTKASTSTNPCKQ